MQPIDSFSGEHAFLSNFADCPNGIYLPVVETRYGQEQLRFPTVEHAYVAAKTQSAEERETIAELATPGKAKRFGREMLLIRPDWEYVRLRIMRRLLTQKFAVGSDLAQRLIDTGDARLIEGNNWHDVFWGACSCGCCPEGSNHLGTLLEERRELLREVAR